MRIGGPGGERDEPEARRGIGGRATDDMIAVVGPGMRLHDKGMDKVVLSLGCFQQAMVGNACVPCHGETTSLFRSLKEARHN